MTDTPGEGDLRERSTLRTSILVGLCCLLLYNVNGRAISAGDTYPARYLPFAIVQYRTVLLNPIEKVARQGRGDDAYWVLQRPSGALMSMYPIAVPVLLSPLYVPAVGYLHLRGWTDARLDFVARVMEKLVASLIAALSAAVLYLALRRRTTTRHALLLTTAYALGTTTWVISSQALWQHGLAQLLVVGALFLVTGPCTTRRAIAVALLCGLIPCVRPPDVFLAAALGLYALYWAGWRRAWMLAVAAVAPLLPLLFYNMHYGGNWVGGYGVIGGLDLFRHPMLQGIAGLLVSPTRGLFVFSPFFLFLALAWRFRPRTRDERILAIAFAIAVILEVLLYSRFDWRAGMSWGSRYFTDLLPFLIWLLVPVVEALRGATRLCFRVAVMLSIGIQCVGAFAYDGSVDVALATFADTPDKLEPAWEWRNSPVFRSVQRGFAPPELGIEMRGAIDSLDVSGPETVITGWALAGDATPWQVAIVVDGTEAFGNRTFVDRTDVRETLGVSSASGWRIVIDTARFTPGEHRAALVVWASALGDRHYVTEQRFTIVARPVSAPPPRAALPDLEQNAASAAAQIRGHQQKDGYWLTSFTGTTRFADARPEMNTFLTSLLVDLLDPIATTSALQDNIRSARQHLTRQIEPGGLVRYHGRPDGPGIGTLGCVITPDADDTALVWRIAPAADRTQLTTALATIERYRTRDGLYRSWLAPRDAYQCLDPGRDPNPTDVAIQMHMLLLLSRAQPDAGRALCTALRGAIDEDRIWVYYDRTPLVPMLRVRDLQRAGCALQLPESRTRTDVGGQEIWLTVARLLSSDAPADPVLVRAVLRELARDEFALLRSDPPLLYHNDLTATVSRYYWSEDVGYALWLRLYEKFRTTGELHPA